MDSANPYQDPANQPLPVPAQDPASGDLTNQTKEAAPAGVFIPPEGRPPMPPTPSQTPETPPPGQAAAQPQSEPPQAESQAEAAPTQTQAEDQAQPQQSPEPQGADQSQTQNQSQLPAAESALIPGMARPMPEETLLEWQAPSRPFKQRNRQSFTTIGLICVLIALILIFAGQLLPVAVIIALFFVYYVLNSTPPGLVTHKLTTYGIRVEDTLYYWEEMGRFWFTQKNTEPLLHIEIARFPNRLTLLLGEIGKDDMQLILSEVLLNQQPPPTAYEKAAQWFQEKLPIDLES